MEPITLGAVVVFSGTTLGQLLVDQVTDLTADVVKGKFKEALSRMGRLRGRRPINHDVQKAILEAQRDANRTFAVSILRRGVSFPILKAYARSLNAWLDAREGASAQLEIADADAINLISAGLSADDGLAFLRAKLEAAVWEDLAQAEPNPPDQALLVFKEQWFDAFVDHLSRQIKQNEPFRNYLQTWLLVEIRGGVHEVGRAALRIEDGLVDISSGVMALASTTASIQGTVEELREYITSDRNGTGSTYPFIHIDKDFPDFGTHPKSSPLPTFEEYRDGNVPVFAFDQSVMDRLDAEGRAFIQGAPSVGKSTLAFRFAAQQWSQACLAYYLDLGTLSEDTRKADVLDALRICRGRPCLAIIDNAHRDGKLAFDCWNAWKSDDGPGRLIVLATRQSDDHDASSKLGGMRLTALEMSNGPADLVAVAAYLYRRATGYDLAVPSEAATLWQARFAGQLHAFSLAIQQSLMDLEHGEYRSLTMERAHDWIRQNWLALDGGATGLEAMALDNLMCIARFGAQELELSVPLIALPFPQEISRLRQIGLCVDVSADVSSSIRLAEHGWGQLILDAASQLPSDDALFEVAIRSPALASNLWLRFTQNGQIDRRALLAERLFGNERFYVNLRRSPPPLVWTFVDGLDKMDRPDLMDRVWEALIEETIPFGGRAWTPPVSMLGALLNRFKDRGQDVSVIWDRLAGVAELGAGEMLRTPLEHLASFLDRANGAIPARARHQLGSKPSDCSAVAATFWESIESRPASLKAKFGREPIAHVVRFIEVARRNGRNVDELWGLFFQSRDTSPAILALEPAAQISPFVTYTPEEGLAREVLLWAVADGGVLVRRLQAEPLGDVASLLDRAHKKNIDLTSVDQALIGVGMDILQPKSLRISYASLASFLKHLSPETKAALLADQPEAFWNELSGRSTGGAPWVARHCKEAGLDDRSLQLLRAIIAKPQTSHFNPFDQAALKLLCWVTAEGLEAGIVGAENHFRAIHSKAWTKGFYGFPAPGANALCDGLRIAALRLSRNIRTILDTPELRRRVNVEARADGGSMESLVKAIRMRGWYGRIAPHEIPAVDNISDDLAVAVVTEGLPHRPEALVLEPFQIDLWVGLRAIAARSGRAIATDRAELERTLAFWEPLQTQESFGLEAQVFHADMVRWLRQALPQARLSPVVLPQ